MKADIHCSRCLNQTNSGFTAEGTFQEYCLAPAKYATHIPDGVTDEEAGMSEYHRITIGY